MLWCITRLISCMLQQPRKHLCGYGRVYVCVCLCVYVLCVFVCVCVCGVILCVCMCVCVHVCVCAHVCMSVSESVHVCAIVYSLVQAPMLVSEQHSPYSTYCATYTSARKGSRDVASQERKKKASLAFHSTRKQHTTHVFPRHACVTGTCAHAHTHTYTHTLM